MRLAVASLTLLVIACAAQASAPQAARPASSANLLRLRPRAWQMPARVAPAGIRLEPETGAPADDPAALATPPTTLRSAPVVRFAPDGSRHAVIGGVIREYLVATIGKDGKLVQDCVHGEAQAKARVEAAGKQVPR